MRAKSTGQGPRYPRILLKDNHILDHCSPFQPSSTADVNIRLGLRGGLNTTTPQTSKTLESRPEIHPPSGVQATFLSAVRTVQLEASHSFSAGSRLFLPPVPIPCGRRKKAASLLRTVSEISPKGPLPFPVPEQFSPVAEGTLQTWATGFAPSLIVMQLFATGVQSFRWKTSKKLRNLVPLWERTLAGSSDRLGGSGWSVRSQRFQHIYRRAVTP